MVVQGEAESPREEKGEVSPAAAALQEAAGKVDQALLRSARRKDKLQPETL